MAGLYIHIPFCRQKCHYCNFFSVATKKHRIEIFDALKQELLLQRDYLHGAKFETIYFGGGTPSLYRPGQLQEIITLADEIFGIADDSEITIEANPDDISREWLGELKSTQINRLSIGLQSLHDEDLKYLNRVHTAKEAVKCVELASKSGFENLSIDFIYGIPTLSDEKWQQNLEWAASLKIPHVSAYALTVEPGTALDHFIRKGKYRPVSDTKAEAQFLFMTNFLQQNGYEHYEISNLALPGKYARHNTAYWSGEKYLGVGPSAHSFDGRSRQWNVSSIKGYIEGMHNRKPDFERELLTESQRLNEYIMTSIRTMWGMDVEKIRLEFGEQKHAHVMQGLAMLQRDDFFKNYGEKIVLTSKGRLFADRIASDLFVEG